jgi:hypothetical protein
VHRGVERRDHLDERALGRSAQIVGRLDRRRERRAAIARTSVEQTIERGVEVGPLGIGREAAGPGLGGVLRGWVLGGRRCIEHAFDDTGGV